MVYWWWTHWWLWQMINVKSFIHVIFLIANITPLWRVRIWTSLARVQLELTFWDKDTTIFFYFTIALIQFLLLKVARIFCSRFFCIIQFISSGHWVGFISYIGSSHHYLTYLKTFSPKVVRTCFIVYEALYYSRWIYLKYLICILCSFSTNLNDCNLSS